MNPNDQFDAVFRAVANFNRRPILTPEQEKAAKAKAHREDPRHQKALAKRRKAKRGGPR